MPANLRRVTVRDRTIGAGEDEDDRLRARRGACSASTGAPDSAWTSTASSGRRNTVRSYTKKGIRDSGFGHERPSPESPNPLIPSPNPYRIRYQVTTAPRRMMRPCRMLPGWR